MTHIEYLHWLRHLRRGSPVIVAEEWIGKRTPAKVERVFLGSTVEQIHVNGWPPFQRRTGKNGPYACLEPVGE